jgi:competence ComEA-like helix-hairpin-helix protein
LTAVLNVNNHRKLPDPADVDVSQVSFVDLGNDTYHNSEDEVDVSVSTEYHKPVLSEFDPNNLDKNGWEDLGFSDKQAKAIVNYRERFGPFKKANDLKKVYVISDKKYEELEPFIYFDEVVEEPDQIELIQINTASQEELESIRGIGPTFAKRTIQYRNILGGYASKEQFASIYGITEDALKALSDNVTIDQAAIKKINLNTAPKEEIRKHPYLKDWSVITAIISERDKKSLRNMNFLIEKGLLNQMEVDNLVPYISY